MVDARLHGEWLNAMRFDQLSDAAWRVFTGGLMWSAEQGTDGSIPTRYVDRLHPEGPQPLAYAELDAAGLWAATETGVQLSGWAEELGQSTAQQVAAYKENARARQRKHRAAKALNAISESSDVTRDNARDVGPGKGFNQREGEPPLFCAQHPKGGAACFACRDARLLHEQWERRQKSRPTPTTPTRLLPDDGHAHEKHPVENYCLLCEQVIA